MRFEPLVHAFLVRPHQRLSSAPHRRPESRRGGGQQALLTRSVQFSHEFTLKFSKVTPRRKSSLTVRGHQLGVSGPRSAGRGRLMSRPANDRRWVEPPRSGVKAGRSGIGALRPVAGGAASGRRCPKGDLGSGARIYVSSRVSSHSIGRRLFCLTTKNRCRYSSTTSLVHDQDAVTQDTASAVVRRVRGKRIVNSVNSSTRLSTSIVPPCCCTTMS